MYQIISDGGCDFTKEEAGHHNIGIIPFYVSFDQTTHLKEGVDISKEEYFRRLSTEKDLFPKTSQPNPQDYMDIYRPHLEEGKDIISLTVSSKLSGTYNSATLAANLIKEDFPERTIIVIDSLNCAVGQGLILREIIKMRDAGYSMEKTIELAEEVIKTTKIYFTPDSLEYLKRGGRVGPTTALVGSVLGLHPVLHLVDGMVEQLDSTRKKKVHKLMEEGIVAALKDDAQDINISIGHILSQEEAAEFKSNVEAALGIKIANPISEVGVAIGTHVGPGALAVAYCRKYETITKQGEAK